MSIPAPRPGTYWNLGQMISIFTFIKDNNPSYDEIEDVALLQIGIKEDTFRGYWNTWTRKGYIILTDDGYQIKDGLIEMMKSNIPAKLGGTKLEPQDPRKETDEELRKEYEQGYLVRMDKKGSGDKKLSFEEWLKKRNPKKTNKLNRPEYQGE